MHRRRGGSPHASVQFSDSRFFKFETTTVFCGCLQIHALLVRD